MIIESSVLPPDIRLVHDSSTLDYGVISDLLASVGMRPRNAEQMERAVRASTEVVVAYRHAEIVGFGRLISDGVYYGTIWDVAVKSAFQGHGIGKAIVRSLLEKARKLQLYMVGLFTALRNRVFYEQLGFTLLDDIHAMTTVSGLIHLDQPENRGE